MAASILFLAGGAFAIWSRLEIRVGGNEFTLRWGAPSIKPGTPVEQATVASVANDSSEKREEQFEVLSAMIRAMIQELQTVEMHQRRDRADIDVRVSSLQEQTLNRWLALRKDMEALYVLTNKGE